jgi:hypothetical protein
MGIDEAVNNFTVTVAAPPQVVHEVLVDVERWHLWNPFVKSARLVTGAVLLGAEGIMEKSTFPGEFPFTVVIRESGFGIREVVPICGTDVAVVLERVVTPVDGGSLVEFSAHVLDGVDRAAIELNPLPFMVAELPEVLAGLAAHVEAR